MKGNKSRVAVVIVGILLCTRAWSQAQTQQAQTQQAQTQQAQTQQAQTQQAQNQEVLKVSCDTLVVDASTNTAAGLLTLTNTSEKPIPLSLHAADFINATTNKGQAAITTFGIPDGNDQKILLTDEIPSGTKTRTFQVEVTKLWDAGESRSKIYNGETYLGELIATKYNVPFNVTLDVRTPENPEIWLTDGQTGQFLLKNGDSMNYPVDLELVIRGIRWNARDVRVPANGSKWITISSQPQWFAGIFGDGLFKGVVRDGQLNMIFHSAAGNVDPSLPGKHYRIKAHFVSTHATAQSVLSNLIIFVVLFLGGISSLILNYLIPNRLRRIDLQERLANLAGGIRSISEKMDSSIRVLVRVERNRISTLLNSTWARWGISPQAATLFAQCTQDVDMLKKRVDLLNEIDDFYQEAEGGPSHLIATFAFLKEDLLHKACTILKNTVIQESELQTVRTLLTEAGNVADGSLQADQKFVEELANRVKKLKEVFGSGGIVETELGKTIRFEIPGVFQMLNRPQLADPTTLLPDDYSFADVNSCKLGLIHEFLTFYEASSDEVRRKKLKELYQGPLKGALILDSFDALRSARFLIQQMREGLYPEDVRLALISAGGVSIRMDPAVPRLNDPLEFSVCFHRDVLNKCAARNEFKPTWDFNHQGLSEKGNVVCHYFPEEKQYIVRVTFEDTAGEKVKLADDQPAVFERTIEVQPVDREKIGDKTKVEALRLGIALCAALFALIAGAKQQILKLDILPGLVAIFLLGFGADTIKNLISGTKADEKGANH